MKQVKRLGKIWARKVLNHRLHIFYWGRLLLRSTKTKNGFLLKNNQWKAGINHEKDINCTEVMIFQIPTVHSTPFALKVDEERTLKSARFPEVVAKCGNVAVQTKKDSKIKSSSFSWYTTQNPFVKFHLYTSLLQKLFLMLRRHISWSSSSYIIIIFLLCMYIFISSGTLFQPPPHFSSINL